jgi:hypothetical protein
MAAARAPAAMDCAAQRRWRQWLRRFVLPHETDNRQFRCDIAGWYTTGGWAFTPGSGTYRTMAWADIGVRLDE